LRYNDRNYQSGDVLLLKETRYSAAAMAEGKPLEYTGRQCFRMVTHLQDAHYIPKAAGWVLLSIRPLTKSEAEYRS